MGKKRTHEEYVAEVAIKNPDVEVLEKFQGVNKKILHRYKKCGHERKVIPSNILQGCGCYQCMIDSRMNTLEDVLDSSKIINSNWTIDGEYNGYNVSTWLKCKKCGYRKFVAPKGKSLSAPCPECEGKKRIMYGVNDLKTLRPDVAELMEDQDLAGKIAVYARIDTWFICPFCGERILAKPSNVSKNGLSCPSCSGGRRYPNRFMYNVLRQVLNDFETEYNDSWTDDRKYDFMLKVNSEKYVIEMDGGQHSKGWSSGRDDKEKIQQNDKYKNELAEQNGFNVIRIDCNYPTGHRFEYIRDNILLSELAKFLDFSNVNWKYADLISQPSDFQRICEMYDNGVHDVNVISEEVGLCTGVVIEHLKHSEAIGCSTYRHKEGKMERNEKRRKRLSISKGQCLLCLETNEIFPSIATAKRYYGGSVDDYLAGRMDYAGELPDGRKIHYRRLQKDEVDIYIRENNCILVDVDFQRDSENRYRRRWKNVIRCNETGQYFISMGFANRTYHTCIGHYFDGRNSHAGELPDGTQLTWSRTTIEEVLQYINSGGVIIEHLTIQND